jgi:hypothetical protein
MLNFPGNTRLPGFRVGFPEDEPGFRVGVPEEPGFRVAPDGSVGQSVDAIRPTDPRYSASEGWSLLSPYWRKSDGQTFNFGGNVASGVGETPLPFGVPRSAPPEFEPVAAGDLSCQGDCSQGGDRGMTGAYRQGRDVLCAKCIVKRLGYENVPSSELPKLLGRWSLDRK